MRIIFSLFVCLFLVACGSDKSEVTSGGGSSGVVSDGGSSSAKFAGTYQGEITTNLTSDSIDDQSSTDALTIVIRTDGTASLTIDGKTVDGSVSGDQFGFSIRIVEERDLLECKGDAVVRGVIASGSLNGDVTGSGSCKLIAASTGIGISGSLQASRI